MTIDITKPVQTRDGRQVVGLVFHDEMFLGWVRDPDRWSGFSPTYWTPDGTVTALGPTPGSNHDLVQAPVKHVLYFNFYGDRGIPLSRGHADKLAASSSVERIACIRVEFEEGRFDV